MSEVRCLLVDDEPLALDILAGYLAQVDGFSVAGRAHSALEAFKFISTNSVDLLFLDIEMPGLSGLDFIRSLKQPPAVIITTAHRKYGVDGYEIDAIDYLLKPVSFPRFLKALQKFQSLLAPPTRANSDFISGNLSVHLDRKTVQISLRSILYAEGMKDYLKIVTTRENFTVKLTLQKLEEQLPSRHFIRIHRSYIVAKSHIKAYTQELVEIADRVLPIGRSYKVQAGKALSQ